jgi:iron-sulfur cluster repair protein YtfE (RIC family)
MNTPPRQHSQHDLPSSGRLSTSRRQPHADEHLQAIHENAEKLRVQHLRMRDSLGALSELIESIMLGCSCGKSTGPDRAAALLVLVDLDRDLPEHFALEEREGFLSSAVATAPRFHRRAARLLLQHGEFCERLTRLLSNARQAGEGVQSWTRLQQDFLSLSGDLLEHERFENDLIGRAHTEDIGSAG